MLLAKHLKLWKKLFSNNQSNCYVNMFHVKNSEKVSISIYNYFISTCKIQFHYNFVNNEQEGHDGPEVAHLYIGPPTPGQFLPKGFYLFIWTDLVDTHKKMFMLNI
jgi:hypothetical protein